MNKVLVAVNRLEEDQLVVNDPDLNFFNDYMKALETIQLQKKQEIYFKESVEELLDNIYTSNSWKLACRVRDTLAWVKRSLKQTKHILTAPLRMHKKPIESAYARWILTNEIDSSGIDSSAIDSDAIVTSASLNELNELNELNKMPLISILIVGCDDAQDGAQVQLNLTLESIQRQSYSNVDICLVQQKISIPFTFDYVTALNEALEIAKGEYVIVCQASDILAPNALHEIVTQINLNPNVSLFYSDEDQIDAQGIRHHPYFKTDWNPDLFLTHNFFGNTVVYRTHLLRDIGGFDPNFAGIENYDASLRSLEALASQSLPVFAQHIPKVLYHVGNAANVEKKCSGLMIDAVSAHLKRQNIHAEVSATSVGLRIKYALPALFKDSPKDSPKVSIIIPTKNSKTLVKQCIDSVLEKTAYANYDIVLIDNGSTETESIQYFETLNQHPQIRVIKDDRAFNYSALNNAAIKQVNSELICLLNNDIEVINSDWLDEMVSQALRPNIGAVGARLWYPNNEIQHAGIILGKGHSTYIARHVFAGLKQNDQGYFNKVGLVQNYCAVTAACLVVKKSLFDEFGGLDEQLSVAFNDIDFCLKLHSAGYYNVYTPYAQLYHHESATRGLDDTAYKQLRWLREGSIILSRYPELIAHDPFYHPDLDIDAPYSIEFE